MEFLKHNWGYVLLVLVVLAVAAAVWYLLFLTGGSDPYAGGMLVKAAEGMRKAVLEAVGA